MRMISFGGRIVKFFLQIPLDLMAQKAANLDLVFARGKGGAAGTVDSSRTSIHLGVCQLLGMHGFMGHKLSNRRGVQRMMQHQSSGAGGRPKW